MRQGHERMAPLRAYRETQGARAQGQGEGGLKDPVARPAAPMPCSVGPRLSWNSDPDPHRKHILLVRSEPHFSLKPPSLAHPVPLHPPLPHPPPQLSPQQPPSSPGRQRRKSGPTRVDWPGAGMTSRVKKRSGQAQHQVKVKVRVSSGSEVKVRITNAVKVTG